MSEHPARRAGQLSQVYVSEGRRDEWLDLFAEADGTTLVLGLGVRGRRHATTERAHDK